MVITKFDQVPSSLKIYLVFRVADYGSFNKLADLLEAISMTVEIVAFPKGVKIVKLLAFDDKSDAPAASEPVSLLNEKNCLTVRSNPQAHSSWNCQ